MYLCTNDMNDNIEKGEWRENVILADADYIDKVVLHLTVYFERLLGRQVPKADMALWADCVALDGGVRQGDNLTQVVLIHSKAKRRLDHFEPSDFAADLTGMAFKDHLGEFAFDAYHAEEDLVGYGDFFVEALQMITAQKEVKRIMVIPNAGDDYIYNKVRETLNGLDDEGKRVTVFAMEPMPGGNFRQEILGYSLMAALRIKAEEIKNNKQ